MSATGRVRLCRSDERPAILKIVNTAAAVYRGAIPDDCWHEPYMSAGELEREIEAGVAFLGYERDGELIGVMGFQPVHNVRLVRHAYVLPDLQRSGVGSALIARIESSSPGRMLVGTWAAAGWAIRFYRRHGFVAVSPAQKVTLLKTYWTVPVRQIEMSVVLAKPPVDEL